MNQTERNGRQSDLLAVAAPDEFFANLRGWPQAAAAVLLSAFAGCLLLAAVLQYTVTVPAYATVRPAGELRLVQAANPGAVRRILVEEDQFVEEGSVIAHIDDSRLQTTRVQLEGSIRQADQEVEQIRAQITALDRQIVAEGDLSDRTVASAESDLELRERRYQQQLVTTAADVEEAQAAVDFAREELSRYETLVKTGVVAEIDVAEKAAKLKGEEAQLERVKAALNPARGEMEMAEEKIVEARARGQASVARLQREREQLLQQRITIETQLASNQGELRQTEVEIENSVIRAPTSGLIQELTLRNPGQVVSVGDLIARIAPSAETIEVKAIVALQDIGNVEIGQAVHMRVSACPYPDYGILRGTVAAISPDAVIAQAGVGNESRGVRSRGGNSGYEVTVTPDTLSLGTPERNCAIQVGMDGQAEIVSREETILRFFLRKARLLSDV